jgi:DNA-binding NarL/FixJ family response regulator
MPEWGFNMGTSDVRIGIMHESEIYAAGLTSALTATGFDAEINPGDISAWLSDHPPERSLLIAKATEAELAGMLVTNPRARLILIVSGQDSSEYQRAFAMGAVGVFSSTCSADSVVAVVNAALNNTVCLPYNVVRQMATTAIVPTADGIWLSDTDRSILTGLASGQRVAAIAQTIGYSERTAYNVLNQLYRRLGITNRSEAISLAGKWGLT